MFIDLAQGLHPDAGQHHEVHKDIIVTPLFTEEFCRDLVRTAEHWEHRMLRHSQPEEDLGYDALHFGRISGLLFEDWVAAWCEHLDPIIRQVWPLTRIPGWQDPFIMRYSPGDTDHLDLHHDYSTVSFNCKLNQDYEGAALTFPRQNWTAQDVPVGHAILWPSTVTHPHSVPEIEQGVKYSLTAWTWPTGTDNMPGIANRFTDHR